METDNQTEQRDMQEEYYRKVAVFNELGSQLLARDEPATSERSDWLEHQIKKLLDQPTLPQTLWMPDDIGFVELLWAAGDDLEVVNDARVSRHVEHDEFSEQDAGLIDFLQRQKPPHWTPFAGSVVKFRIKMPIFVSREWFRSGVGFNRNEVSRRYVKSDPDIYIPSSLRQAPEPGQNKQGVQDAPEHVMSKALIRAMQGEAIRAVALYNKLVGSGVAPEQARGVLPQNMYTEFRELGSLAAYHRLCSQRIHPAAQLETRLYAEAVSQLIKPFFPHSWRFA